MPLVVIVGGGLVYDRYGALPVVGDPVRGWRRRDWCWRPRWVSRHRCATSRSVAAVGFAVVALARPPLLDVLLALARLSVALSVWRHGR